MWFDYSGDPKDTCCSSFLILRATFGIILGVCAVSLLFNVIILLEGGFILVFTGSLGVWTALLFFVNIDCQCHHQCQCQTILLEGGFILVFTGSLGVWAAAKQNRGSTAGVRTIMITSVIVIIVIIMKTIINFISNFLFIKKCSSFQWMLLLLLLLVSESVGSILLLLYRQPALHRLQVDSSDFVLFLLFSSIPFNFYISFVLLLTMLSRCIYSTN